jgi:helix-turn-helix protein
MTDDIRALEASGSNLTDRCWTVNDVARFLGCSTKVVRALVRSEGLVAFRLRSRLRFLPSDVYLWARRRREGR